VHEARPAVGHQVVVDELVACPPRQRLRHREPQRVASPAEVEGRLVLDRHRQVLREVCDRTDVDELTAKRPNRQLGHQLGRRGAAGDDEHVAGQVARIGPLADVDAELHRAADELRRHGGRLGHAVLPASDRAGHVVEAEPAHARRVDLLGRDAEGALHRRPLAQTLPAVLARSEEHVADLLEERRSELAEEPGTLLRQPHLGLGRELLAETAHRLAGRTRRDPVALGQHHVARAEQREVVRDRGAYCARTGNDDSSHASSSTRSSSVSVRSGRRTSGCIGTPRRATTSLAAA